MRRTLFLLIIGLGGVAILLWLGFWQVSRLGEKQAYISNIDARIAADPVALPETPDEAADAYLPVRVSGTPMDGAARILVSQKDKGAGYRIIVPFRTDAGRVILVDFGVRPVDAAPKPVAQTQMVLSGNLQWPQEVDKFTPDPDLTSDLWFARDVPLLAATLNTEPVLLVVRQTEPVLDGIDPLPVDTSRIPNDHLQYAITWFSLAAIWLGMSFYFLRRRAPKPKG